jgi:DNA topoisomerase-1
VNEDKAQDLPEGLEAVGPETFEVVRRKHGHGFAYYYEKGNRPVRDARVKRRLEEIGVPNTWKDVRLSLNSDSHIQAAGYDGSGKLQYLYHPEYLEYRNLQKFEELPAFGAALPRMRRRISRDLRGEHWTETRLLALLVRILDRYHLRIGTRVYAKRNDTFGLTTLRKRHLKEHESQLAFEYRAKGGRNTTVHLTDPRLVALVREVAEFPGWELFSIPTGEGKVTANAERINDYIRAISGEDFTARTFRTWAGTVLCVKYHERAVRRVADNPRRQLPAVLTELVAERLGNTPPVCREYYIHPEVFETATQEDFDPVPQGRPLVGRSLYRKHECRTMEILGGD